MIKDLVSILTPCYNTGKLLYRLLDSILMQDYPYVEMFAIDDGSSDDTSEVIKAYIPKFAAKGYTLNYVYQENSGQSVAINNGLKMIKGEYLVWPDSDDFYSTSNALSTMVNVFKENDASVSIVRCLSEFIDEDSFQVVDKFPFATKTDWFEDCLFVRPGSWYCPGGYMTRVDILDRCIKGREIYVEKNAGQNWQLLLPLLHQKKCITINEYHYKILVRGASHSRGQYKSYEEQLRKIQSYENTIVSTLSNMSTLSDEQLNQYVKDINIKYLRERYYLSWIFLKRNAALKIQKDLKDRFGEVFPLKTRLRMEVLWMYKRIKKCLFR